MTTQETVRNEQHEGAAADAGARGGVVVGYDGSPSAVEALTWAAVEAAQRGAALTVLSAADVFTASQGAPPIVDEVAARQRALAEEGVAAVDQIYGGMGPGASEVLARVELTHPTGALVEASKDAELVVIGNRGRGRVAGVLLGSVAFSVSAAAACPVVVVRGETFERPGPTAPVVVGVDASPGALDAVAFAADAARRDDAPLVVLAAWTNPDVMAEGWVGSYDSELINWARDSATAAAEGAAQTARDAHPGLDVSVRVVEQRAAEAIAGASTDAGLLVVGARGLGSARSLFLGSVSHAAIHRAHCPVAVVRCLDAG